MKIIGVTGSSGAGKTTVCNIIKENYNIKIIDSDKIVKELSKKGSRYFEEIVKHFGTEILNSELELDRKKLANIIFSDSIKRNELNSITEKHVVSYINKKIDECAKTELQIVIDVPLLFESSLHEKCNIIIGVISAEEFKIERICKRDSIPSDVAHKRIIVQKDDEFLIKNSDYIITNNSNKEELEQQIDLIFNKNIVYKNDGKLKYIQFKKLLEYPELKHAFFMKPLDFTAKEYENLEDNYKKACEVLKITQDKIVKPHQTHTDNIYNIYDETGIHIKKLENIDGLVTNQNEKALSLVFADCIPIYLYDSIKKVIGNVHSGWKGTLQKISKKAVVNMINEYNCNPSDIICVIGPAIRKCHFEVEEDVYNLFKDKFMYAKEWEKITSEAVNGKYCLDTILINKVILKEVGIKEENIIDSGICTVCNSKIMHSYRTDKEKSREKCKYNNVKIEWRKYVSNI